MRCIIDTICIKLMIFVKQIYIQTYIFIYVSKCIQIQKKEEM